MAVVIKKKPIVPEGESESGDIGHEDLSGAAEVAKEALDKMADEVVASVAGGVVKAKLLAGNKVPLINPDTFEAKAHTLLGYGDSGSLKSWAGIQLAIYTLEKFGKTTRVIYADQGGFKDLDEAREAGIVDVFNLHQAKSANAAMMKVARGEWPDKNGVFQPWELNGGGDIGLYIFDSMSGISEAMMQELLDNRQQLSEDVVAAYTYYDEKFSAPSRAHYGAVQRNIRKVLATIPNLPVERIYITALTGKGEEALSKQIVYGPLTMGKALTNSLPSLIGDLFHMERIQVSSAPTPKWENRAWFKPHPDPSTGIDYPAKVRLSSGIAELDAIYPKGYILQGQSQQGKSIVDYVRWRDDIGNRKIDEYKELLAKFKRKS